MEEYGLFTTFYRCAHINCLILYTMNSANQTCLVCHFNLQVDVKINIYHYGRNPKHLGINAYGLHFKDTIDFTLMCYAPWMEVQSVLDCKIIDIRQDEHIHVSHLVNVDLSYLSFSTLALSSQGVRPADN